MPRTRPATRWLLGLMLAAGLAGGGTCPVGAVPPPAGGRADRVVFLARGLSDEEVIVLSSTLAAARRPGVLLLDSPPAAAALHAFLASFRPHTIIPVGVPPGKDLVDGFGGTVAAAVAMPQGRPEALWRAWFPTAGRVVVCPARPRRLLLQAACLAGAAGAPLFVLGEDDVEVLRARLASWHTREVYAVAEAARQCAKLPGMRVTDLAGEAAVADAHAKHLRKHGPVTTLVVANPADGARGHENLSPLAARAALQHRAALVLTGPAGDDVEGRVRTALLRPGLGRADHVLLLGGLKALPPERRPNPLPGKDEHIDAEPLTPSAGEPASFAVGRLFHADPAQVALLLARPRLLPPPGTPRRALVASNPGDSLPLMETFSRNTAREFRNAGYTTTTLFGHEVTRHALRRALPDCDVFLWEGHHNTLVNDWDFPRWDEPLPPSFLFLQSCLALHDWKVQPLFERGALAVAGSSTRTYSASGGAFALAYFNALLYDGQTAGGSLRHAKNFLLAYSELKGRRLGEDAPRTGANLRSAWAFTLWGDPTLKLPAPPRPADALSYVRHAVRGDTLTVTVPGEVHEVGTPRYCTRMPANGRLAGLVRPEDGMLQELATLVFVEVPLPHGPAGRVPRLHGRLPSRRRVFCWDARRRTGYLLALPREHDRQLRFRIRWEPADPLQTTSRGDGASAAPVR